MSATKLTLKQTAVQHVNASKKIFQVTKMTRNSYLLSSQNIKFKLLFFIKVEFLTFIIYNTSVLFIFVP